jgi:hypothetical protein
MRHSGNNICDVHLMIIFLAVRGRVAQWEIWIAVGKSVWSLRHVGKQDVGQCVGVVGRGRGE